MALNGEEFELKKEAELKKVKEMLSKSSIYSDINKIIDAYNAEQKLATDDLFASKTSEQDKKFNVVRYTEAKAFLDSGKLDREIKELQERLKSHKYFLAKNREKDKMALEDLSEKREKIKNLASLIDTKNDWNKIISDHYPVPNKNAFIHSMPYFVDIYKDLSINMEKICYRHIGDESFVKKLNDSIESDMASANGNSEQGREDYQFALKARKAFVEALESNYKRYFPNAGKENSNNAEFGE